MKFNEAIEHILKHEGGYVNDPDDLGGETNMGITKRFYPDVDIKNLTVEQAKEIYKRDYWDKAKCDALPENVRLMHFDTAVNMGIGRANKFLQEAIGVTVDGIVGKNTLAAAHKCNLKVYARVRLIFYTNIVLNKPVQKKFLKGWYNRTLDVLINSIK